MHNTTRILTRFSKGEQTHLTTVAFFLTAVGFVALAHVVYYVVWGTALLLSVLGAGH